MSGPKGYGYRVVSTEELRRRDDDARAGRCGHLTAVLAELAGQLRQFGASSVPDALEPSTLTHDSLISWEFSLQSAIDDARNCLREESGRAIVRRVSAARASADVEGLTLGVRRAPARSGSSGPAADTALDGVTADVRKVIDFVAEIRDAAMREDLAQMAERVLRTTSAAQAKGDLLSLKTKAVKALEVQGHQDMAAQAVMDIAHLEGDQAAAVRRLASAVRSAEELSEVKAAVASLLEVATRASDAEFVESALEDVLKELGFTLGGGFELADLSRSVAIADHADHPGYGVRVQLNPENGMIYTRVVAERATSPEDDIRAEDETCAKVHAMAENLARHGVTAELRLERQPGEVPVERHAATPGRTKQKRTRTRAARRMRRAQ